MFTTSGIRLLKVASRAPLVRWRAGHTLGVLDELPQHPRTPAMVRMGERDDSGLSRGGVLVEVFLDQPGRERLPNADDEIIERACAIALYAGRPVRLVTMDTGMAMRGRSAGLRVHKVPRDIGEEPEEVEGPSRRAQRRERRLEREATRPGGAGAGGTS